MTIFQTYWFHMTVSWIRNMYCLIWKHKHIVGTRVHWVQTLKPSTGTQTQKCTPIWHVLEILPCVTRTYLFYTVLILYPLSWVLMFWWHRKPEHQQPWYLLCWTGIILCTSRDQMRMSHRVIQMCYQLVNKVQLPVHGMEIVRFIFGVNNHFNIWQHRFWLIHLSNFKAIRKTKKKTACNFAVFKPFHSWVTFTFIPSEPCGVILKGPSPHPRLSIQLQITVGSGHMAPCMSIKKEGGHTISSGK